MTPKQRLLAHIREMHTGRQQPSRWATYLGLASWHARQHHRYWTNHYHQAPGEVLNNMNSRPRGWHTGEDPVPR